MVAMEALPTIVGAALQQQAALLQDAEVSQADEVVVHARHLSIPGQPRGAWGPQTDTRSPRPPYYSSARVSPR